MSSISSTFDKDADGWTVKGDPKSFDWHKSGGNPGGYLGWVDSGGGTASFYAAPDKFLGNDKAYYGGQLSYDVEDSKSGNYLSNDPDLILYDGKHALVAVGSAMVGSGWTHETITLDTKHLFDYDLSSGQVSEASKSEIKEVLSKLAVLYIRAEYYDGKDKGGLDNVVLATKGGGHGSVAAAAPAHFGANSHLIDAMHLGSSAFLDHHHLAIA